jgi:hypothetical protein
VFWKDMHEGFIFLAVLANVVLFMWEFKHGAFDQGVKISQQPLREPIVLVGELKAKLAVSADVDFISLFPRGFGSAIR